MPIFTSGIRFFAAALLNLFAFVAESCRRILFAWARVDRLACGLALGMLIGAFLLESSFCLWMAIGAVGCLSMAAWRGDQWNLKKDTEIASRSFKQGWERTSKNAAQARSAGRASKTTFSGGIDIHRHPISWDTLMQRFHEQIVGQSQAKDLIESRLASLALGTRPKTKAPLSFLFVGPTGTGKGEFASLIAEIMERSVAKFNMGEYNNDQTLWTLLGSPKGYANPEEGLLTRAVRNDPKAVLFFDEIEKGHPRIFDIFLSILDDKDGTFGDLKTGEKLHCCETIVIFACNLLGNLAADQRSTQNGLRDELRSTGALRSEFVARITSVVPFYKLTPDELGLITERQVAAYLEDVCDRRGYAAQITVDAEVVQHLISKQDPKYGARNVRASIEEVVEPALRLALMQMGDRVPETVHVRKATETTLEVAMH